MTSAIDSIRDRVLWAFGFVPPESASPTERADRDASIDPARSGWDEQRGTESALEALSATFAGGPSVEDAQGSIRNVARDAGTDRETVEEVLTAVVEERARTEATNEYFAETIREIAERAEEDTETAQDVLRGAVSWLQLFAWTASRRFGVDRDAAARLAVIVLTRMAWADVPEGSNRPDPPTSEEDEGGRAFEPSVRAVLNALSVLFVFGLVVGNLLRQFEITETTIALLGIAGGFFGGSVVSAPEGE